MKSVIVVLFIVLMVVICYSMSGGLIMLLWNILAGFFGFKKITFLIGVTVSVALSFVGGFFKRAKND